jgi:hypothetical protein
MFNREGVVQKNVLFAHYNFLYGLPRVQVETRLPQCLVFGRVIRACGSAPGVRPARGAPLFGGYPEPRV